MAQQIRELMTPTRGVARHCVGARGRLRHAGRRYWGCDCY